MSVQLCICDVNLSVLLTLNDNATEHTLMTLPRHIVADVALIAWITRLLSDSAVLSA